MTRPQALAVLLIVGVVAVSVAAEAPALTLSTDGPGNLLPAGAAAVVHIANAPADCAWRLTDVDGKEVAAGTATPAAGKADVKLPVLSHGYYEFAAKCGDASGKISLGAITDRSGQAPPSGRINVDAAASWLTRGEQFEPVARMLRMMGIGWVRERFSWGGTEPERGQPQVQQYEASAAAYTKQGVRVYQIWHDSPGWTHAGKEDTRNPEDLREVYAFTRRIAAQYKGRVLAWEVWNEPDIGFWPDLSDTYAGLLKAAYLGFKAGDPDLPVLQGSFCSGVRDFDRGLMEAGAADYFDIFNWHIYAPPEMYGAALQSYLELLKPFGAADRPVWLTEAGIPLKATEPDGELNAADERKQADYVPRSYALSLAAGTDRHFFFVFPYYLENGVQFGCLHRDLSPRPACVATAAAVEFLGETEYLGRLQQADAPDVTALAFRRGGETVVVAWSSKAQEIKLTANAPAVTVADVFGRRRQVNTQGGKLTLPIGPAAQYVVGLKEQDLGTLTGPVRPAGKLPANKPCPIIIRGQLTGAPLDKQHDAYLMDIKPCTYNVEAYNFGDKPTRGTVALTLPEGWKAERTEAEVALEPMGRAVATFTVTPGPAVIGLLKLVAVPRFGTEKVAPSVSHLRFDFGKVPVRETLDVKLNDAARWAKNISGNDAMEITATDDGPRFDVHFRQPGDRWCYPVVTFDPPADFAQYAGIAYDYRCGGTDKMNVRLQLYESGGAGYLNDGGGVTGEWKTITTAFSDFGWGSFSPADANARLDLKDISRLMIGLNTTEDDVWLQVRNIRLVRW